MKSRFASVPSTWTYIGQEKTKKNLKYILKQQNSEVMFSIMCCLRPPGLGKTTLAGIIANEMGTHMKVTRRPGDRKPGEMAAILNNLQEGDVLLLMRSTA